MAMEVAVNDVIYCVPEESVRWWLGIGNLAPNASAKLRFAVALVAAAWYQDAAALRDHAGVVIGDEPPPLATVSPSCWDEVFLSFFTCNWHDSHRRLMELLQAVDPWLTLHDLLVSTPLADGGALQLPGGALLDSTNLREMEN